MNKIWITNDFMCKISKYTQAKCVYIRLIVYHCVCLFVHSLTYTERNEKFVACHFSVHKSVYLSFRFLSGGETVRCRCRESEREGFCLNLIDIDSNARNPDSSMSAFERDFIHAMRIIADHRLFHSGRGFIDTYVRICCSGKLSCHAFSQTNKQINPTNQTK